MGFAAGWGMTFDRLAAHLANPALPADSPQAARPQHGWLTRLLGRWDCEGEASMEPGQPPLKTGGTEQVRLLGGLWAVAERQGQCPGGTPAATLFTLGYDPQRDSFQASWVLSMMPHLWLYQGRLDAAAQVLTLEAEGPDFSRGGRLARFRETIAFTDDDHRVVTTTAEDEEGAWTPMLTMRCRRVG